MKRTMTTTIGLRSPARDDTPARLFVGLALRLAPRLRLAEDGAGVHALAADGTWLAALFARANGDACVSWLNGDGSQSSAWAHAGLA